MYACVGVCHKGRIESLLLFTSECLCVRKCIRMYLCVHTHAHTIMVDRKLGSMHVHAFLTCINTSVIVHTQSVIRTIVTDLVYETT